MTISDRSLLRFDGVRILITEVVVYKTLKNFLTTSHLCYFQSNSLAKCKQVYGIRKGCAEIYLSV
jgi:hypothetical protein